MLSLAVNPRYPNRIELDLATIAGPLSSSTLGSFDPRRDVEVYVDGLPVAIQSFSYDSYRNRYLMFSAAPIDTSGVVQTIHHMPVSPFSGGGTTLPGFALLAAPVTAPDYTPPSVVLSAPVDVSAGEYLTLLWIAVNVTQIQVTGTNGYNSGLLSAAGVAGIVYIGPLLTGTFTFTVAGLDANGNPIIYNGVPVTASVTATALGSGFNINPFGEGPFGV